MLMRAGGQVARRLTLDAGGDNTIMAWADKFPVHVC